MEFESLETTQEKMRMVLEELTWNEARIRQSSEQGFERNPAFVTPELSANAEMYSEAKCHMVARIRSMNIEAVCVVKTALIAIARGVEEFEMGAFGKWYASQFNLPSRSAKKTLDGRVEPERLFDRVRYPSAVFQNRLQLFGRFDRKPIPCKDRRLERPLSFAEQPACLAPVLDRVRQIDQVRLGRIVKERPHALVRRAAAALYQE